MLCSFLTLAVTTAVASAVPRRPPYGWHHQSQDFLGGITSDASAVANKTFDYVICGGGLVAIFFAIKNHMLTVMQFDWIDSCESSFGGS